MAATPEWDDPNKMTSVDAVFDRVVASVSRLPAITVPLLEARGLIVAQDIIADSNVPPFQNSAMDGYAVRSSDVDEPATLRLCGTIAAGSGTSTFIASGSAARIMTGALVPDGADAVVRFEEVTRDGELIHIDRRVTPGENVRLAGEDVRAGDVVLPCGKQIGAAEIGMLAAINIASVRVHRRPRIGILSTGDEVIDVGPALGAGQIRDANAYALSASIEALGGIPVRLGIATDSERDIRERIRSARDCDLIVTSGGVSVGDFDLVKEVLRQEGQIEVLTVRMKPGKPLAFGLIGDQPLIGLPGNPVAAIVSFDQFVRPAILKMLGHVHLMLPVVQARLMSEVNNRGRRRHFERGKLSYDSGEWVVSPTEIHGSAMLSSLVAANCYIVVREDVDCVVEGTVVDVQILDVSNIFASEGGIATSREKVLKQ